MSKLRMIVDGWSSSNVGFGVIDADTRRDGAAREFTAQRVPQRATYVLTAPRPEYERRTLEVEGTFLVDGTSTDFRANLDELIHRISDYGTVPISFSDSTDRVFYARYIERSHEHLTKASFSDDRVELSFDLLDPFERDTDATVVSPATGGTSIALGTAPTEDWIARAVGPSTNPSFVYADASGTEVFRADFTTTLTSTEFLELDAGTGNIVDQSGASKQAARDSGTDWPWALDPEDGFVSYLSLPGESGDYASTPDATALDITGDIDLRAAVAMDDWTPGGTQILMSKWDSGVGGYRIALRDNSDLLFRWTDSGGTNRFERSAPVSGRVDDGGILLVRVTLDVDNGAGGYEVAFYTKASTPSEAASDIVDNTGWDSLAADSGTGGSTTSIGTSSVDLAVGASPTGFASIAGKVYAAAILDGIDGTVVFNADFTDHAEGTTSFTEDSSNGATVTINQSGIRHAEIVHQETHPTHDPIFAIQGASSGQLLYRKAYG